MNPFDPSNPADESLFSGRKRELADARSSFDRTLENRPDHILFYGDRGIGKTSIINHLRNEYKKQNAFFVFCGLGQCASMDDVVEQFVTRFYHELTSSGTAPGIVKRLTNFLSSIKAFTVGSFSVSFDSKDDVRQVTPHFSHLVGSCWKEIESAFRCLVVVFDEADKIAKSGHPAEAFAKDYVFAMRNVIEEVGRQGLGRIKFILSATPEVRQKIEQIHESLLRSLRIIELGNFDVEAMKELLEKGIFVSGCPLRYEPAFLQGVAKYSNGIPYHVQAICHYAFDSDRDGVLSLDDLRSGIVGAIQRLNQYPFGGWWKQVENWSQARPLLILLAESSGTSSLDSLSEATEVARGTISTNLSRLREVGFVSATDARGIYTLSSPLCKLWIDKYLRGVADNALSVE